MRAWSEFGQVVGLVHERGPLAPPLMQRHVLSEARRLPCRFAAREAARDGALTDVIELR